jgi:ketol-acid reductoisomerase
MKKLTIIGFGNQTQAWANNLKDSGWTIKILCRQKSGSLSKAIAAGFDAEEFSPQAFSQAETIALLTPDNTHHTFFEENKKDLKSGTKIILAHGYSMVRHDLAHQYPEFQFILFAPKAIGSELRSQYLIKGKLGAIYSLEYISEEKKLEIDQWCLALSYGLGINLGPYKASFKTEMEADLLSEQGVLCSLIPYTAKSMFELMLKRGIEPELAFFECWYELKLIINAMIEVGPEAFYDLISPNALIGSEIGQERLMTKDFQTRLESLFDDIQSGTFLENAEKVDVPALRQKIKMRWNQSPLEQTQKRILQGK